MSWKSFACVAALSALITSPVLAAPSLSVDLVRDGGGIAQLDASGNWQWLLRVTVDAEGSTAAELEAIFSDSDVVSAAISNSIAFDTPNPTPSTLAWINVVDGILVDGAQANPATNEAVVAVGSDVLTVVPADTYDVALFTTVGPSTAGSLTSSIAVSGNVAQLTVNNPGLSVMASAIALIGDTDLDGDVDLFDGGALVGALGTSSGQIWTNGDFDGDGDVDLFDGGALVGALGSTGSAPVLAAVPEPTSICLAMLGFASALVANRKR